MTSDAVESPSVAERMPDYYEEIFERLPCAVFVIDEAMAIFDFNAAAFGLMVKEPSSEVIQLLSGDALGCMHASPCGGCGARAACADCGLREAVSESIRTRTAGMRVASMDRVRGDELVRTRFLVTTAPIDIQARRMTLVMLQDIGEPEGAKKSGTD
jgi:PAS domain-containing protein